MSITSPEIATNTLWVVWYVTWILAVVWSAKTTKQMGRDMSSIWRAFFSLGLLWLFLPAGTGAPFLGSEFAGRAMRRLWQEPDELKWTLFALTVAGFAFCWWARLHLGRLWSGFVTLKEGHHIVDTGPYGLVRHPIYTGVIFAALMTALLRATPLAFAGFALVVLGLSMIAKTEERFLSEQLGAEAYDSYRKRVPMLVPGVG
jgi:protein-S-isoprenylcysteine O-methyltransferase Ste14